MKQLHQLLLAVCLALVAMSAGADGELDGDLTIVSADAAFNKGVVEMNAEVRYPLTDKVSEALRDGVTLTFELEVVISRPRKFWWDADVVSLDLRQDLSYHVISDRYLLRGPTGDEQSSYPTLVAALEDLGKVEKMPVAVDAQLRGGGPWEVSLRAGVRRGHIPDALRTLLFWRNDWHRSSAWHTWTLER